MKKGHIILLLMLLNLAPAGAEAQTIVYHNLGHVMANEGDTIKLPRSLTIEKRTKSQIMLTGGADYKVSANTKSLNQHIHSRYYAVRVDSTLYINCRKLRINKFRFGKYHAPAMPVNGKLYFSAQPVGPAATALSGSADSGLGEFGDAISNTSVASKRVYYEIDPATNEIEFVGKAKMLALLENYPEWREAFLRENKVEAWITGKYLRRLRGAEGR